MSQLLKPISRKFWPKLRDLYTGHEKYPATTGLLDNYINWITKEPSYKVDIYTLNGNWLLSGTFILIDYNFEIPHVYCNTLNGDLKSLTAALNCLNLKSKHIIAIVSKCHMPAINKHLMTKQVRIQESNYFSAIWYHISREEALQFTAKAPENIIFSNIKIQYAEKINNLWPLKGPGTLDFIKNLIYFNDNVGAYDSNGNLIGWCMRMPYGGIGVLQVVESYKRHGIGSLLVRYMAKHIASKNEEVIAPVINYNHISRLMFEKLGFKCVDEIVNVIVPGITEYVDNSCKVS